MTTSKVANKAAIKKSPEPPSKQKKTDETLLAELYNIKGLPFTEQNARITPVFIKRGNKMYPLIFEYESHYSHFSYFLKNSYDYISIYGKQYNTICEVCSLKYKCITDNIQKKSGCKNCIIQKNILETEERTLEPNLTDTQIQERAERRFYENKQKK